MFILLGTLSATVLMSDTDNNNLSSTSALIFITLVVVVVVILIYFFYYADRDETEVFEPIPNDMIGTDDTIINVFERVKNDYGWRTALRGLENTETVDEHSRYNSVKYDEYWDECQMFSQKLLYFIGPHPRVAIMSLNRPEWFYSHLGTMMSGGISVGIYPTASPDNCEYIINHSHVDMIVVENDKQLSKLRNAKMESVKLILVLTDIHKQAESDGGTSAHDLMESIRTSNPNLEILTYDGFVSTPFDSTMNTEIEVSKPHPEDVATVIYTSGTTGPPKGVVQTHGSIIGAIQNCLYSVRSRSNIDIGIGERFVSYLPLNHIAAQMMDLYVPICSIGVVTFAGADALKGSLKYTLLQSKPTVFIGVPRVWEKIEETIRKELDTSAIKRLVATNKMIQMKIGLESAKYCIAAAAPLSDSTREFFETIGIELCNVYGMSETCGPISVGVPGSSKGAGVPVMDVKIDKESGEIMVRGNSLFKEYYKDKDATKKSFKRRWFKTGDIGNIDRSGSLHITGRLKDLIITAGGENISPIPIEEKIVDELKFRHIDTEHVVVIGNDRKFVSVLIFCSSKNKTKLESIMESVIEKTNKDAPNPSSTVKKFCVIDRELEIGKTLTPTLKIRRPQIDEAFSVEIDNLYRE